ncbi:DUF624 domain-containing protein [Microbacterium amylolyticum]|uniref:Membrane protein YesL n=1 Tax=Microbacterium amylolyticum TaxID=936337 RepID=A0ABS4ZH45_9MICO|nr:DUF624 domain-containing protein [Microbacterium amylolyticum]MBP2436368.1 putative membrane protein YesL [Microbacterium amylolyticum]
MKRIPHSFYSAIFHTCYLVLGINIALAVSCLPLIVLLVTTDPSLSWPLMAPAAAVCAPALGAAFGVFREHSDGERSVFRPFLRTYRAVFWRALAVGAITSAVVTVAAVDVFVLVPTGVGALVAPLLVVLALLALVTGATALVGIAEAPAARLSVALRAALLLAVRRWPLAIGTLAVIGVQAIIFVQAPAIAIGVTAGAVWYVVWSGGRYTLQPALVAAA